MRHLLTFCIMLGFWLVLSGKFDLFHLTLGVFSSGLVSFLSTDLLFPKKSDEGGFGGFVRFCLYLPWLFKEILLSTLHVTILSLHPRMREMIDPTVVNFKTVLKKPISRVALANSITLTPGTITIRITDDVFYVHAISRQTAASLPGDMETKLQKVFE